MGRHLRWAALAAIVVGLIGCDFGTKELATDSLRGAPPVTLVGSVLDLRYVENHDAAFNLLERLDLAPTAPVLAALALCVLAGALVFWWHRRRRPLREHLPLALVVAGAVGNLADRVRLGYVVDFIHVHHWPVFNVADIAVGVGVGLLVVGGLTKKTDSPSEAS